MVEDENAEGMDVAPGSDPGGEEDASQRNRRKLLDMAREADKLYSAKDEKLNKVVEMVKDLLKDGYRPILFCRFIPTASGGAATTSLRCWRQSCRRPCTSLCWKVRCTASGPQPRRWTSTPSSEGSTSRTPFAANRGVWTGGQCSSWMTSAPPGRHWRRPVER